MCWTPAIIPMHRITRTMHYFRQCSLIDCVVSAVVQQVYSSTFKFCLLKIQEICPPKRFIFTSKCTKMRLVAKLRPDLLGELTALPRLGLPDFKSRSTGDFCTRFRVSNGHERCSCCCSCSTSWGYCYQIFLSLRLCRFSTDQNQNFLHILMKILHQPTVGIFGFRL